MSQEAPDQQRLVAGRYRLRHLIGQGSMGTVWAAYDEDLRRPVAVKEVLLAPGIPAGEADELRERTMREARAIAVLSHPNVVTLHDIAREHGEPYVVMELVPGRSLAHVLATQGALDPQQAAVVADAVASALQAAHVAGITHRDVKPGNVLVAEDGRIKLTDFGIARNVAEHTLTRTGIMLGSPAYIAPEVASGEDVTPRADLWGLGATLFAAVEGRAPYDPDGDVMETLSQVVHGDVPRPTITGPLAEVITGLMVKEPTRRMSLAEVRRLIYPLLPEPGRAVFSAEAIRRFEVVGSDLPTRVTGKPVMAGGPHGPDGPAGSRGEQSAPLAAAPGPLPFAPARPQSVPSAPARRRTVSPFVVALAVLLFVVSVGGGFALTRMISGRPLLPPTPMSGQQQPRADPSVSALAPQTAEAAPRNNTAGGGFTVEVPENWTKFVEERLEKALPASTRVQFVSPDGKHALFVERYPGFYPGHDISEYQDALESSWPKEDYRPLTQKEVAAPDRNGAAQALELMYRTVDRARDAGEARRTTFARVLRINQDLWVVGLTAPTEEEDGGRDLFARVMPTFRVTG